MSKATGKRELIELHRAEIMSLAAEHGAFEVRLFGSVNRHEDDDASDIDLLVRFEPGRGLFNHAALQRKLAELLGCSVDVVSEGALLEESHKQILAKARAI